MHLYIHVPFCQRRCSYCDFSIAVRRQIPAREYVDVILKEARGADFGELETLYFGGGTPSLLPADAIAELVQELPSLRRTPHAAREVTIEANPEDVTVDSACAWRAAGINRVSLGAQSFDDAVLKWMHRSHDAEQTHRAVRALRDAGIENISLDLIFGLPEELHRNWERDLDILCSLLPAHCSLYGLTVEPRTPLDRWISRGATQAPNDDRYAEEYLTAHRRLTAIRSMKCRTRRCQAFALNTTPRTGRARRTSGWVRRRTRSTGEHDAGTCGPGKRIGGPSPRGGLRSNRRKRFRPSSGIWRRSISDSERSRVYPSPPFAALRRPSPPPWAGCSKKAEGSSAHLRAGYD